MNAIETNDRNPARWSEAVWATILSILASYIRKWSGTDSPAELSPEARDEIRSRIVMDILTGEIPDGMSPMHYVFRTARQWRVRGWNGDTELNRQRMRAERAAAKKARRDDGSRESEEARNKDPFRGVSDDARQPTPLAQLVALETATREGLRYVSDRQRKARRKPVKGKPGPVTHKVRIVGRVGRPMVGFGQSGRPLYFPGAATRIAFEPIAPTYETDGGWVGKVANRAIGKAQTEALGCDTVGRAMARMAILGRETRRAFQRAPLPTRGVPATAGDGTEWRAMRD